MTEKLGELWCVEYDIIEEGYIKLAESRGVDAGHNNVQVSAEPFKLKYVRAGRAERVLGGGR